MKIKKVTEEVIVFDNATVITYDHCQDCCEDNYADFKQIESVTFNGIFVEVIFLQAMSGKVIERFSGSRQILHATGREKYRKQYA